MWFWIIASLCVLVFLPPSLKMNGIFLVVVIVQRWGIMSTMNVGLISGRAEPIANNMGRKACECECGCNRMISVRIKDRKKHCKTEKGIEKKGGKKNKDQLFKGILFYFHDSLQGGWSMKGNKKWYLKLHTNITFPVTGQNPPGHVPPGHLPQGHIPPGHLPPGHLPPRHLPPRTYTPQDIYPLYFKMPYLVHASCVDYILHFKKYLFCRNSICLWCRCNNAVRYLLCQEGINPHNYSGFR